MQIECLELRIPKYSGHLKTGHPMSTFDSHESSRSTSYRNGRACSLFGLMASECGKLGPNAASAAHSGLKSWQVRLQALEIKFCAVLDRSSRIAVSRKCDVATLTTGVQDDAERRQRECFGGGCRCGMTHWREWASLAATGELRLPSCWRQERHDTHVNMLSCLNRRALGVVSRALVTVHHQRMDAFSVKSLDHVVITAKDIPTTIEFYTKRLGMKHEVFKASGGERHALSFGNQKLNLHQSGKEFEPKAQRVQPGSEDLCFITDHPIDEVLKSWQSNGIEVRHSLCVVCA